MLFESVESPALSRPGTTVYVSRRTFEMYSLTMFVTTCIPGHGFGGILDELFDPSRRIASDDNLVTDSWLLFYMFIVIPEV